MAEEEKPAEESAASPPKAKSKLPLIAGAAVAVLLLGGGGTFFVLRKGGEAPKEESAEHASEEHGEEAGEAHGDEHAEKAEGHGETHEAEPEGHGEEAAEADHGGGDGEHGEGGPPAPQFVSVDSFVVNINDGERDRFLKLKIDLEVSNAEVVKELEQRMPQVKDIMIGLLSSQSFAAIRSMEGKDSLREQVQARINAVVRTGVVKQVLFTEFVVQ